MRIVSTIDPDTGHVTLDMSQVTQPLIGKKRYSARSRVAHSNIPVRTVGFSWSVIPKNERQARQRAIACLTTLLDGRQVPYRHPDTATGHKSHASQALSAIRHDPGFRQLMASAGEHAWDGKSVPPWLLVPIASESIAAELVIAMMDAGFEPRWDDLAQGPGMLSPTRLLPMSVCMRLGCAPQDAANLFEQAAIYRMSTGSATEWPAAVSAVSTLLRAGAVPGNESVHAALMGIPYLEYSHWHSSKSQTPLVTRPLSVPADFWSSAPAVKRADDASTRAGEVAHAWVSQAFDILARPMFSAEALAGVLGRMLEDRGFTVALASEKRGAQHMQTLSALRGFLDTPGMGQSYVKEGGVAGYLLDTKHQGNLRTAVLDAFSASPGFHDRTGGEWERILTGFTTGYLRRTVAPESTNRKHVLSQAWCEWMGMDDRVSASLCGGVDAMFGIHSRLPELDEHIQWEPSRATERLLADAACDGMLRATEFLSGDDLRRFCETAIEDANVALSTGSQTAVGSGTDAGVASLVESVTGLLKSLEKDDLVHVLGLDSLTQFAERLQSSRRSAVDPLKEGFAKTMSACEHRAHAAPQPYRPRRFGVTS